MPKISKECIMNKAKDAWKCMTETKMEFQVKASFTPMMLMTMAVGCATALCLMRAAHKMEIQMALRKQQKAFCKQAKENEA